jgi:predicted DsbA family dithiol-disulfide isomerase
MKTLNIDVISDVVCPWCFVGKRRLEGALALWAAEYPDVVPYVRWHTFQLNPEMAPQGIDRETYVRTKFGDRADSVYDRVTGVGHEVGIAFEFDRIARQPNTLVPHSLIAAAEPGLEQERMVEALFQSYFLDGRDLTNPDVLQGIADAAGLDPELAHQAIHDPAVHAQTAACDKEARDMGVSGVPFFIFNGRVGVSGAHESQSLLQAMRESLQENE